MTTLLIDDLDHDAMGDEIVTRIRRRNLVTAWRWRWRWEMPTAYWTKMELLCLQEWGKNWRDEVARG